jgi:hypothetical protein
MECGGADLQSVGGSSQRQLVIRNLIRKLRCRGGFSVSGALLDETLVTLTVFAKTFVVQVTKE